MEVTDIELAELLQKLEGGLSPGQAAEFRSILANLDAEEPEPRRRLETAVVCALILRTRTLH